MNLPENAIAAEQRSPVAMPPGTRTIVLQSKDVAWALGLITAVLLLAHATVQFMRFGLGHGRLYGLYSLFHLGHEANIPTYFSALLLLTAGLLLAVIADCKRRIHDPFRFHWIILSIGFFYLSVDEAAQIHELLARPTKEILDSHVAQEILSSPYVSGAAARPWVIPAAALVLVCAAVYLRFLLHLPPKPRFIMFAAGTLYIGAAIGLEVIAPRYGAREIIYLIFVTVEETLEMASIVLFIYGLLNYVETYLGGIRVHIGVWPSDSSTS